MVLTLYGSPQYGAYVWDDLDFSVERVQGGTAAPLDLPG